LAAEGVPKVGNPFGVAPNEKAVRAFEPGKEASLKHLATLSAGELTAKENVRFRRSSLDLEMAFMGRHQPRLGCWFGID